MNDIIIAYKTLERCAVMEDKDKSLFDAEVFSADAGRQRIEWRRKAWSIPDLRGSKQDWFVLTKGLLELVESGQAAEPDSCPQIDSLSDLQTWRTYAAFLKGMGLAKSRSGVLSLTETGAAFLRQPTRRALADIIQDKVRLFGEALAVIRFAPAAVEEVDAVLRESYNLNWSNLSNTRRRMDWLEVLELIQNVGNRKWAVTEAGEETLKDWLLVSPEALADTDSGKENVSVPEPPPEIAALLRRLSDAPELHEKRCTYNIWAPSPNRIENLRVIIQFASERVKRGDFFQFIESQFNLKESSVDSMMPFLKASGLLEEVGRNIYQATAAGQAWLRSGDDLDFIRILHANMKFVGEMVVSAKDDIIRNDLYAIAKNYGINTEKARWIAGFLIEAGLLEEPQYLHLKATQTGMLLASSLPLQGEPSEKVDKESISLDKNQADNAISDEEQLFERLHCASCDPMAEGKASGVAFEEEIAEVFRYMGFDAKRIGGAGNTDVVVRWKDNEGKSITAIVDGKSKTSGMVSHTDISDVAIDTHKEKNNADYVAIIGPGFSGDTIRNHAKKKNFALITVTELVEIARSAHSLGLSLQEIASLFIVPNGLSQIDELISSKQRELDIISEVVAKLCQEQELLGSLSPRDLFLLLRTTNVSPSMDELLLVFKTLSQPEIGLLAPVNSASSEENTTYMLYNGEKAVNRLHALANAIEKGLSS